jgi:hypothetical protein
MRVQKRKNREINCYIGNDIGILFHKIAKNREFWLHSAINLRIALGDVTNRVNSQTMTKPVIMVLEVINVLLVQRAVGETAR